MTLSPTPTQSKDTGMYAAARAPSELLSRPRSKPLAIDLFCGLGGWTEGLLEAGYYVVGFDIERHEYGDQKYPAQLVIQDVLTLHGSQFKDAALIVASPPCQEFSYMAMPWSLAKQKRARIKADPAEQKRLTALFDACFRIQREACEARGGHIPMVVENVRGAQEWVGRAKWNYGSFYLWGDLPALMPPIKKAAKLSGLPDGHFPSGGLAQGYLDGLKGIPHRPSGHWTNPAENGLKVAGLNWGKYGQPGYKAQGFNVTAAQRFRQNAEGVKSGGDWFNAEQPSISRTTSSKSDSRKAASAMIAKIPLPLSQHIARTYLPQASAA